MRTLSVFIVPILMFAAVAQGRGPHVHGHGKIAIAFDNASGTVEMTAPGDSVYGFEREAKSKNDKSRVEKVNADIQKRIGEMVTFHASLNCQFTKTSIENVRDGSHSEMQAKFSVLCDRSPRGTTLRLNPAKVFKKLTDVDATILIDDAQKSAEAGPKGTEVAL